MTASLAEAKSHEISKDVFLQHWEALEEANRKKDDAALEVSAAKKAAKHAAVSMRSLKLVQDLRKLDVDEQILVLKQVIWMAEALEMDIGHQFSLLDAPKMMPPRTSRQQAHDLWSVGEDGLKAGRNGESPHNNPYDPGSEHHAVWARKHVEGRAERAVAARMRPETDDTPVADNAPATRRGRPRKATSDQVGESLDRARDHLGGNGDARH